MLGGVQTGEAQVAPQIGTWSDYVWGDEAMNLHLHAQTVVEVLEKIVDLRISCELQIVPVHHL
ncbi:hypothetical protein D3C75_1239260 [compost metagenome]